EASGRERRARPQRKTLCRGVRREPTAGLGGAHRHPGARAEGIHCGRGQTLLSAQRYRRARLDPRLHRQSRVVGAPARRLDHHATDRQEPAGRRGPDLRAQIREMIVASRVEQTLSKAEILELYLNSVYLGRSSWGVEMAARSYFGKPANELTLEEGALLAGLTKGPNAFNPDRHPGRAQERLAYVLSRLQEDGVITGEPLGRGLPPLPALVPYERPRRDIGFHFVDQVAREAKSIAGVEAITANSYTVRSTINPQLQRAVEAALQEGLSRYERSTGRTQFRGAEGNLSQAILRIEADKKGGDKRPAWQRALATARPPLYDVHWTPAIVLEKPTGKKGETWRVGLADGRILPLSVDNATALRKLTLYDVVLTHVTDGSGKTATRADLRVRPVVQGAVVVLE